MEVMNGMSGFFAMFPRLMPKKPESKKTVKNAQSQPRKHAKRSQFLLRLSLGRPLKPPLGIEKSKNLNLILNFANKF